MHVRRLVVALTVAAGLAATATACGTQAEESAKQAGYETLRVQLQETLSSTGLTNVVVVVEKETDTTKVKGNPPAATSGSKPKPSTSASAGAKQSTTPRKPTTSTATYDILSATFDIPGLTCRGNVEQRVTPLGTPYFDEVIFPDGTDVEIAEASRGFLTRGTIFEYVFMKYPQCRQKDVTTP